MGVFVFTYFRECVCMYEDVWVRCSRMGIRGGVTRCHRERRAGLPLMAGAPASGAECNPKRNNERHHVFHACAEH